MGVDLGNTEELIEDSLEEVVPQKCNTKEKEDKFSFSSFLLQGIYYMGKERVDIGLFLLLISAVVPLRYYFVVGLISGFFVGGYSVGKKTSIKGLVLSVVGVIVFIAVKILRWRFTGRF